MSDVPTYEDVAGAVAGDIFALLIGGPISGRFGDPQLRQIANYGPGLLRRLSQSFQGDPVGRLLSLNPLAAATPLVVPDMAQSCTFCVDSNPVRMTLDGTVPTAAVGLALPAGTLMTLTGRQTMQSAQFIQNGGNATIQAAFFT